MEVCNRYVTGYVLRGFHNSILVGGEARFVGPWASCYNSLVKMLKGVRKKHGAIHTLLMMYVTAVGGVDFQEATML